MWLRCLKVCAESRFLASNSSINGSLAVSGAITSILVEDVLSTGDVVVANIENRSTFSLSLVRGRVCIVRALELCFFVLRIDGLRCCAFWYLRS